LSAAAQAHNVLEFPQPENNPEEFYAVTEIPAGGSLSMKPTPKRDLSSPTAFSRCRWLTRQTTVR
jgi:hypothetical protein